MNSQPTGQKRGFLLLLALVCVFLIPANVPATMPTTREEDMIRKTMKNAHITSVAAVSIAGGEKTFFSFGNAVNDSSLFYIGSLSKSFTGYAILCLEETGRLSLNDPVTTYIPWFEAFYQNQNVAGNITLADLLYQTSGFTNNEKQFPNAFGKMDLEENIRNLSGRELVFSPSSQFSYANANYNILGYIIEQVTGVPYADYMESEIFTPLGLVNTYASLDDNDRTPIPGTRVAFGKAWNDQRPVSEGAVPAGYILSCSRDLSRWLQIHLGNIKLPSAYQNALSKSHVPCEASKVDERTHYAAGWYTDDLDGRIYHSGGVPNYSSRLVMDMENENAAVVLTNLNASANTNDIADNMILLLKGETNLSYQQDIWTIMDIIFSLIAVFSVLFCGLFFLSIFKAKRLKRPLGKTWYRWSAAAMLLTIACLFILPAILENPWDVIVIWAPPSIIAGIGALALLSLFSFICIGVLKKKQKTLLMDKKEVLK